MIDLDSFLLGVVVTLVVLIVINMLMLGLLFHENAHDD